MFFKDKKLQYDPKEFEKEFNKKSGSFNSNSKQFGDKQNEIMNSINEFIIKMLNKLLEIKQINSNKTARDLIEKVIKIEPVLKIIISVILLLVFLSSPIFFVILIVVGLAIINDKKNKQ